MKLEEAIEVLKTWVDTDREIRDFTKGQKPRSDYEGFCERRNIAIETVLEELTVQKGGTQ